MITGVNHTSFTVSDLDKSLAFYNDLLRMPVLSIAERPIEFGEKVVAIPGAHLKIAYLDAWGHKLELIQYLSHPRGRVTTQTCDVGSAHLCFNVDDIYTMVRELTAKGVKFKGDPQVIPAGTNKGGLVVYLEDFDGITLEFIQPPKSKLNANT